MSDTQHTPHEKSAIASEPMSAYGVQTGLVSSAKRASAERMTKSGTMSVDEYFDKLLSKVHDHYANL